MVALIFLFLNLIASPFKSKSRLEAENAALKQQLIVLQRKVRGRVRFTNSDRVFFIQLYRWCPSVLKAMMIIRPETLVRWHRAGLRRYWRWKSRSAGGRPQIHAELRALIWRMSVDNRLWGAPHIHGELLKLGFAVAQSTVASLEDFMHSFRHLLPGAHRITSSPQAACRPSPLRPSKRRCASASRYLPFKPLAHLAVQLSASHMTMSQASAAVEHDAVATVLIIGASRGIGLETVKTALEAGHSVRALARSARRIPIDHPKLEKMAGDALEIATVKRALREVDVVTQSLGIPAGPEIILKPTRFFYKATRVLVTAMEEAQVKRLICVTGFGAVDSRGHGGFLYNAAFHLLLGRVYDDKDVQERIVRRSKLDCVIVRPVILTDGPKTNAYRALVDPRDWTCGFISRADVADFLVKQIDDDALLHKTPVLTS